MRAERASNSPAPSTSASSSTAAPAAPRAPSSTPTASAPQASSTTPASSTPPASPPPASTPPAAPPADDEDPPPAAAGGDVSFEADVYPILSTSCAPCHGAGGISGISVANTNADDARDNAIAEEDAILGRIESGSMPQGCGGPPGSGGVCLTEEEFATLKDWYEAGAPE